MFNPFKTPVVKARTDIKLRKPKMSRFVIFLLNWLGRLYLFLFYGIARICLRGEMDLFHAFKRALAGESRCIIAFRHPNGGEPSLLAWFFLFRLRFLAAMHGVRFSRKAHAIFVYGYDVARWGGWVARFVLPRIGGMPIHHSKIDREGMSRIYDALVNGPYPVAISPEGQVSYSIETVPRLEQGAIRIGFHAAERLNDINSNIPLEILPITIHFRFGSWGRITMELLIRRIEKYTSAGKSREKRKLGFPERMSIARDHVLEVNEKRYQIKTDKSLSCEERLDAIMNAAMQTAESILGVKTEGDFFSRVYTLFQTCWDRIVIPGVDTFRDKTGIERGSADLLAGEAWYASRHVELVNLVWYIKKSEIPTESTPLHQKVEYVQNLWDLISRSVGGAYAERISILPRRVIIQSGLPINLSTRLRDYKNDRKAAVQTALDDLEKAYLDCIDKVNKRE